MTDICQYCGHELNTGGTCLNPACPGRLGEEEVSELIPCPFRTTDTSWPSKSLQVIRFSRKIRLATA